MGSPCDTFTEVKWHPLDDQEHGPRPLRSCSEPFGRFNIGLTFSEMDKVADHNIIASHSVDLAYGQLESKHCFILENPVPVMQVEQHLSFWEFPPVANLLASPHVVTFDFPQCVFGSSSKKPTRFAVGHGALTREQILHCCDVFAVSSHHPTHRRRLGGKTKDGEFRTNAVRCIQTR